MMLHGRMSITEVTLLVWAQLTCPFSQSMRPRQKKHKTHKKVVGFDSYKGFSQVSTTWLGRTVATEDEISNVYKEVSGVLQYMKSSSRR